MKEELSLLNLISAFEKSEKSAYFKTSYEKDVIRVVDLINKALFAKT